MLKRPRRRKIAEPIRREFAQPGRGSPPSTLARALAARRPRHTIHGRKRGFPDRPAARLGADPLHPPETRSAHVPAARRAGAGSLQPLLSSARTLTVRHCLNCCGRGRYDYAVDARAAGGSGTSKPSPCAMPSTPPARGRPPCGSASPTTAKALCLRRRGQLHRNPRCVANCARTCWERPTRD